MTRTLPVALVAAAFATVSLASQQVPTFRAGTRTASVYATVVDSGGRLVTDLTQDDFDIFDNGVRQHVSLFANGLQPITIVVMLDRSGSMEKNFGLVQKAAEQFVNRLLPADKARIGSFSTRIQIDPAAFTSDRAELIRILHNDLLKAGPTPLWSAADVAMTALAAETGRRVVLLFTDGRDNPAGESISFGSVRRRAQADEIMIYGIGLSGPCAPSPSPSGLQKAQVFFQRRGGGGRGGRGLPPIRFPGRGGTFPGRNPGGMPNVPRPSFPPAERDAGEPCAWAKPDPDLRLVADDNGGGYFELHDTDNLSATFSRVALELHHQYLLAFTPAVLDGATHTLDVRVRQTGLTVRARKSYVASPEK